MQTKKDTTEKDDNRPATAVLAAGCFWGVEEAFRTAPGVLATEVGYTGGTTESPTYESVCAHGTGHAEAVKITFDPKKISFGELLNIFWRTHDPTTLNRQGPDVGDQYRSEIFVVDDEQRRQAEISKAAAQSGFASPIVTRISAAGPWWKAEEYHQQYFLKRGGGTCHI